MDWNLRSITQFSMYQYINLDINVIPWMLFHFYCGTFPLKSFPKSWRSLSVHQLWMNFIITTLYRFLLLKILKKIIASSTRMIHVPYIGSWNLNCVRIKVLVQFCQFVLYLTWIKHKNLICKLAILCFSQKALYSFWIWK